MEHKIQTVFHTVYGFTVLLVAENIMNSNLQYISIMVNGY